MARVGQSRCIGDGEGNVIRVGVCQQDLARSSGGELAKFALVLVAEQAIERISSNDDRWASLLSVNRG